MVKLLPSRSRVSEIDKLRCIFLLALSAITGTTSELFSAIFILIVRTFSLPDTKTRLNRFSQTAGERFELPLLLVPAILNISEVTLLSVVL